MDHYFRDALKISFDAFDKTVERARPEDLCERDVIRLVNLAKSIEVKIGKENQVVVKKPFDVDNG